MALVIVPRVLREKLGEDGADALVALFNEANGQTKGEVLTFVEEKFERCLSEEVGKLNERLTTELSKVNVEFARVRQDMAELKADLLRWMFIFWVGQIGALLGILFAFFRR